MTLSVYFLKQSSCWNTRQTERQTDSTNVIGVSFARVGTPNNNRLHAEYLVRGTGIDKLRYTLQIISLEFTAVFNGRRQKVILRILGTKIWKIFTLSTRL